MNTGVSFVLAVIALLVLLVALGSAVGHRLRSMQPDPYAEALGALDGFLLSDDPRQPPWCLRELDPNFVDWQAREWL